MAFAFFLVQRCIGVSQSALIVYNR